jgi:hypothetical protein
MKTESGSVYFVDVVKLRFIFCSLFNFAVINTDFITSNDWSMIKVLGRINPPVR